MRAVNLLPSDLRSAAPKAAPSARQEKAEGIGAYVVLGALALCVAALAVYVLATNAVKQKQTDLAEVTAQADVAAQAAAKLKPYADFDSMAKARVETVRGLAAARFDWEQALRDLSRAMPADVKLETLSGDMGLPGTNASGGGDPLRGSIQAPAITLVGCANSQPAVARMLSRLRAVDGVTRVSLSKSEKLDTDAAQSACSAVDAPKFSTVVFFERSAALAAMAPAAADAASASTVPVPNAVAGGETANGSGSASAEGNSANGGTGDSASSGASSTTTTTTTSGADAP